MDHGLLQLRLGGVRDALRRTRFAFFVSLIVSITIFISTWNAGFSWDRAFALSEQFPENEITKYIHQAFLTEWVRSTLVAPTLLGIRVGISDAPIIGSLSLLLVAVWSFLVWRRANHSVAMLLIDTAKGDDDDVRETVYHGVVNQLTTP